MDRSSLVSPRDRLRKVFPFLAIALAVSVAALGGLPSRASDSDDLATLLRVERKLFHQTYESQTIDQRLARLEKRVFGEVLGGATAERVSRLGDIAGPQTNPDGLTVPAAAPARVEEPPAPARGEPDLQPFTPPVVASALPPAQTQISGRPATAIVEPAATDAVDDQECAIERARVAVMAAKEEEIKNLLAEGVQAFRDGRKQQALERFEQVVRLEPNNAEAHFSMGIIEESAGNLVEAVESYRLALKARPSNQDYKDAVAAAEKKLSARQKVDDDSSEIRRLAEDALAAYKRGEFLSAIDLYKHLDERKPNQHLIKYNIGTLYLQLSQPQRALEYYRQALRLNPREPKYAEACHRLQGALGSNTTTASVKEATGKRSGRGESRHTESAGNLMSSYGLKGKSSSDGVVVTTVGIASRAARTGIQRGDIIRAVEGTIVRNPDDVNQILSRKGAGAPVQMMIQRANNMAQLTL